MKSNIQENKFLRPRTAVILGMILAAATLRIAPHPFNFAPIGAIALFGGAYFSSKRAALAIPLFSLIAGDIFIGFHKLVPYVYASFLVSVLIGFLLRRTRSVARIGAGTVVGATQFFLVTNFGVWVSGIGTYPKTANGLITCYVAGIPLFWNTLASDVFYTALLFGAMALIEYGFPSLREPLVADGR